MSSISTLTIQSFQFQTFFFYQTSPLQTAETCGPPGLLISSHLIGHHVKEVAVDAGAAHPLWGWHRASEQLVLAHHNSTFGHELGAQTAFPQRAREDPHILAEARTGPQKGLLERGVPRVQRVVLPRRFWWISCDSSPTGLLVAETLSMGPGSAASQGNELFCCSCPACLHSPTVLAAGRKEGAMVEKARCPPSSLPPVPVRLGSEWREDREGGGRLCVYSICSSCPFPQHWISSSKIQNRQHVCLNSDITQRPVSGLNLSSCL